MGIREKNISADVGDEILFRHSVRGYNTAEVDEYIYNMNADNEELKNECDELREKLDRALSEIEEYKKNEERVKELYARAERDGEKIISDAKSRAAHIIMRTSGQCGSIVEEMSRRVEEQKRVYNAAKEEMFEFRRRIFDMYKEHIRLINALAEAAGASEKDALSQDELSDFDAMMSDVGYDGKISEELALEIERIKRGDTADKKTDGSREDFKNDSENDLEKNSEKDSEKDSETKAESNAETEANVVPDFENPENSENSENNNDNNEKNEKNEKNVSDGNEINEYIPYANGEGESDGFELGRADMPDFVDDDDVDEFYNENDEEFYPSSEDGVLTGTVGSFGFDIESAIDNARENSKSSGRRNKKQSVIRDAYDSVTEDDG